MQQDNRPLYIIGGIALVIIIAGLILMGINSARNRGTGIIEVQAKIPTDSTAKVDGEKIDTNREIRLKAGKHTLAVSRTGFKTDSRTITVEADQEPQLYAMYLKVANNTGEAWLANHQDAAIELEGEGSRSYEAAAAQTTLDNPIVQQLPLLDPQFRIDYGSSAKYPTDNSKVGIYIQAADPTARQAALSLLRDKGFDPADLELIFVTPQV